MSILEIKNLSHIFDAKPLFDHANVTVNNGEHIGVVGLNGAGKSTFINIISGSLSQDDGEVIWNNGISKGYLDQHANIERNQTIMEYLLTAFSDLIADNARMEKLYEDMSNISDPKELDRLIQKANNILDRLTNNGFFDIDSTIKKVANGLGINNLGYDTEVSTLSGGQRAKLMLSKLLLLKPDVMMLDEPTNFLDIEHIAWLVDFLNTFEGTYLVISHDTDFLDKVCKYIISIQNGEIKKYGGNYSQFLTLAEQNNQQYIESYEKQQREIEKMQDYIARNKARAATAGMANARKKMLDKMDVIRKPTVIYDAEFSFPHIPLATRDLIDIKQLEIGYTGALLPPIDLHMDSENKIWIRGTNGIGKSTLVKTLLNKLPPISGGFAWHPFAKIGYLEQDLSFTSTDINANAYVAEFFPRLSTKEIRAHLARVGIKNDLCTKSLSELSGGEQVRVKLCLLSLSGHNVLVLDEPTNHLDVRAKAALETALQSFKGAIILISHEKAFAEAVCDDIFDVKT